MKRNDMLMLVGAGLALYILSRNKVAQVQNDADLAKAVLPPATPQPDFLDRTTVDEFIAGYEFAAPTVPTEWETLFG
jgi:hypothetical protein